MGKESTYICSFVISQYHVQISILVSWKETSRFIGVSIFFLTITVVSPQVLAYFSSWSSKLPCEILHSCVKFFILLSLRHNEVYTWNNVNSCVHNIIVGQLWIEQVSDIGFRGGGLWWGTPYNRGRERKIAGGKNLKGLEAGEIGEISQSKKG